MSVNTKIELRNLFIYQVYLRNHTKTGSIKEFIKDLDRIKALGVDYIYFLPIHEIGQKQKKGDLGCPYSIKDYRSVNHEYGTIEDFTLLVDEIHKRDMKVMLDVVFNHTSYDSVLINEHPEYFYKINGKFSNRVGDWWDITDLDYTVDKALWVELIDTLKYWTGLGVDGYRWDVASILPLEFLEAAHEAVLDLKPDTIFLSESVHGGFVRYLRKQGFKALSESEIFSVFDIAYDYDTHPYFESYLKKEGTLRRYLEEVVRQEEIYSENYIKLRNLENHDFGRFARLVDNDPIKIDNWTAFMFFNKGCAMIYGGQEFSDSNQPSLFDIDKVNWGGRDISSLITKMAKMLKEEVLIKGYYDIVFQEKDVIVATYELNNEKLVGVFNVSKEQGYVTIELTDGVYKNIISGNDVVVSSNQIKIQKEPVIFWGR